MIRRTFHMTALAAVAVSVAGFAASQDFPSDTIRLIVPYQPGGGTDTISRAFAAAMEEIAGQAVVVENIPGSSGINGMLAMLQSEPDGHTIAVNGSLDITGAIALRDDPPFSLDELACAGGIFNTPAWVLSHADNGYSDLGAFIEDAKAQPGELNVGITGKLSATDFVASAVKGTSGADFNIVNFEGGGPLIKAILANQIAAGVIISPVLAAEVEGGTLNILAAAGDMEGIKYEAAQGTPHIREWGADLDVSIVRGIWMPAGVPEDVQAKMEALVKATVESDAFQAFGDNFGYAPYTQTGADFCARLPKEVEDLHNVQDAYMTDN